jgi:hypothetical protein
MCISIRSHGIGEFLQALDLIPHCLSDMKPPQTIGDLFWFGFPNGMVVIPDTRHHPLASDFGKGCIYRILVCP